MALRIRKDGRVLCAALHDPEPGDAYLDDGVHYELSVERRCLVTEAMPAHAEHGQWWWKGQEPPTATIDPFYYEVSALTERGGGSPTWAGHSGHPSRSVSARTPLVSRASLRTLEGALNPGSPGGVQKGERT